MEAVHRRVASVEHETRRLTTVLDDVIRKLAARTANAARLSVAHVATTDRMCGHATECLKEIEERTETFLADVAMLKGKFEDLKQVAMQSSAVRTEVIKLEIQVSRLSLAGK